jgi:hypothetical protein
MGADDIVRSPRKMRQESSPIARQRDLGQWAGDSARALATRTPSRIGVFDPVRGARWSRRSGMCPEVSPAPRSQARTPISIVASDLAVTEGGALRPCASGAVRSR